MHRVAEPLWSGEAFAVAEVRFVALTVPRSRNAVEAGTPVPHQSKLSPA